MRTRPVVLLAVALAACATAPASPPREEPLPPGVSLAPDAAVMTLDGTPVTYGDLPDEVRALAGEFPVKRAAAREKAFRARLDQVLLELEARRRGIATSRLWQDEALAKVAPATDDEARATFEKHPAWFQGKPFETVRPMIDGIVLQEKLDAREAELVRALEATFPVKPGASPANAGPDDEVLATVGGTRVRRRELAPALRRADQAVSFELFLARARAAEVRIDERLAVAEAERRGVPLQALKDDRAAMERLRGGHEVKLLLEVPAEVGWTPDLEGSPVRGRADATVTVVEYGDFQCPPCGHTWPVVHAALASYGDRVRFAFRNVPMPFHERAVLAAEAARAAQAQGKFFEYADLLFGHQAALDRASLEGYARELGLDEARFAAELAAGRYRPGIYWERRDALQRGLRGTPTYLVNGRPLPREARTVEAIRAVIDAALAAAGGAPAAAGR